MANDQIKKADNGTYYFRANLGFDHSTGKRIQKYRSGFKTKKEAKEEYAKLVLQFASQSLPTEQKRIPFGTFIEDTYLPWYQTQVKESTFENRAGTVRKHFSCFYEKFTDAIEPIDIQNWQLASSAQDIARTTCASHRECSPLPSTVPSYWVLRKGTRHGWSATFVGRNRLWTSGRLMSSRR